MSETLILSANPAHDARASLVQSLVAQSPALIAIRGNDGTYLYANESFAQLLNLPAESLPGRHEDDVLHTAGAPRALRIGNSAATEVTHSEEEAIVGLRARRFLITRFPLRAGDSEVIASGMIATEIGTRTGSLPNPAEYAEARHAELLHALEQMERIAYTDRLTGAWNRRHLEDAALLEMSRAERHGHAVSLLVLDVDHFKEINDQLGHAVGDYVLVELVRRIRSGIRRADTITRWGGEEFVVLAPDTALREAKQLAHKLCARVEEAHLSSARPVTISVGVAEYHCGEGFEHWLARADRAMYRAKNTGRNRVVADPYSAYASDGTRLASSPVELVWRESYRSGNERVDHQHRQLFKHANRLLQAVIAHAPRAEVLEAMEVLVEDITTHFTEEERLHAAIGYPDREAHAAEHGHLLALANDLFERARLDAELPIAEVFQFLAYDIVAQHLVGADRQYFPYLETPPASTST
ncbi:diguanylate cyclase [Aromatoleum petrolei]|uniref:diguanylate cyclase n=1 Tax=Aromatoleum petrolei TaxID=76116 RepID=A0ABX1MPF8_9RHOO|nr:diguanylate cyclase [Aromatoleum petrolei]NMF89828.1 diguanylate cyclase [Aromatoleum petrolei]QTQ36990.1 GGDEF domain-containing protein [Aromatoleum petrolei]